MKFWNSKRRKHDEEEIDHTGRFAPGQKDDVIRRSGFRSVIDMVESLQWGIENSIQRAAIFDYAIWALGQQIAADGHGIFVSGGITPNNPFYDPSKNFPSLEAVHLGKQFFDISKIPTYTGPWERGRFPKTLSSLLKNGYKHTEASNDGTYYKELGFAVMMNGRHHTSWSIYMGSCIEELDVITLEPYFPVVQTDGAYFIYTNCDGNKVQNQTNDYRFAAMYRLAQMRWELGYPIGSIRGLVEGREHIIQEKADYVQKLLVNIDLPENMKKAYDYFLKENNRLKIELKLSKEERNILAERCVRKNRRIEELEQKLASSPQNNP